MNGVYHFGAGNGELCKWLAGRFTESRIICYEPHPGLLQQAREKLAAFRSIEFAGSLSELPDQAADLVFCLEVFEHLPPTESEQAISSIIALLGEGGHAIIGVPVEVGFPALLKGSVDAFCEDLVTNAGVLLLPGSLYGPDYNAFRVGFGRKTLPEALEKFENYLKRN